jgi:fructoselysine-6-P-deglycase FrlB-like protein
MAAIRAKSSTLDDEVRTQPECWRRAAELAPNVVLPERGARVAIVGCGTSHYVAQAMASWREAEGGGETDAFPASEALLGRPYDVVVGVTRSGTTTEVLQALEPLGARSVIVITARPDSPASALAGSSVVLDFADEDAIVQTRFATTAVALWRARLGHNVSSLARDAESQLRADLPARLTQHRQFVFLGQGPGLGIANEAALKMREAALLWSEAYPSMEFRHGPFSVIDEHSLIWSLGPLPPNLEDEIAGTGASLEAGSGDPLVELVRIQRAAIELARSKGLDPNAPRRLSRSVTF